MNLIIQIPCFNESQTLPSVLADLPKSIPGVDSIEVLVIDDGSVDGTAEVARANGVRHVLTLKRHLGLAGAFRAGLSHALSLGADVVVNTDGDNQYCGAQVADLVAPVVAGRADLVIGCRDIEAIAHFSATKKVLQRLGSAVVRHLSGTRVADTTSGFRSYSRSAARRIHILSNFSYTLESIIQAGAEGFAIGTVPIRTNPKTRESRLYRSLSHYVIASSLTLLRAYLRYRPLKVFSQISAVVCAVGLGGIVRFLVYYAIGQGAGHIQSLFLSGVLLLLGFQIFLIGLVGDLLAVNRTLLQEIHERTSKNGK
ncbi:MAG: glycosyltransferase family 2 protein [Planctomycetes bacterium]|nr:glycosyltransferase family 2 protein [Planctomycetota bacterium]